MKEVTFIRQNIEKWREMEHLIETASAQPSDRLCDVYIELTSDLAFSQTHFPRSRITIYLNNLASALHRTLYRTRREKWGRILTFWSREVPQAVYQARREMLWSLLIFLAFTLIGCLSQMGDSNFARLILGDSYVDMTLENIAKGDPMGVYKEGGRVVSFLGITFNNIKVSFTCFAAGLFTSLGTGYMLMYNGVMVGCFQTFFAQHGVLTESLLGIWLHGVIEISSIVVAGGAGITMGNGWLFPGTYTRMESFRRSARRGMKIVMGTVPLFVLAGFVEGFFTRHTEWPVAVRLGWIILSIAFILFYFVYLPLKQKYGNNNPHPQNPTL